MIRKISDLIYKISGVFIVAALGIMVILVVMQVVLRYAFNEGFFWSQEAVTFLMIWMVFIGHSMGLRQDEIIALSFLTDRMSEKTALLCKIITEVIFVIFLFFVVYYNIPILKAFMKIITPGLHIPLGLVQLSLTIGGVLMIFYSIIRIHDNIRIIAKSLKSEE
jgi:C4-dicarboxylate transporter DctQ subunit